jgi:hypothetical protein
VHEAPSGREHELRVPMVNLDAVIPEERVDLVKIDVEGFEPQVLSGMKGILGRSPDAAVVVEIALPQWARFGDPFELLREAADGRDVYRIHTDGWVQPMSAADPSAVLEPGAVCYLLLLPPTEARRRQIAPFLTRSQDPRPLSLRRSRFKRLQVRLRDWLNGR